MEDQHKTKEELIEELRIHQIELEMQNHELQRFEKELELARDTYSDLFDFSPVGYVTLSDEDVILKANLTSASLLGIERTWLISQTFSRFILKDDQDIFFLHRKKVLASSQRQTCDLRIITRDGTLFHARLEMSLVTPGQLQPGQLRVVIINATESKRLEEELQYHQYHLEELIQKRSSELFEVQDKFKFITESIMDIVWMMDMDLRVTYVSPSVERVMGYSPEERQGKTLDDIVTGESLQKMHQTFADELQKEREGTADPDRTITLVAQYFKKDGSTIWLENRVRGIRDSNGTLIGLHGLSRDVSERLSLEEALRRSEEKYRSIFNNASAGINLKSPEGVFLEVNQSLADILGYNPEQLIGMSYLDVTHPDDVSISMKFSDSLMEGDAETYNIEKRYLRKDGKTIWGNASVSALRDSDGMLSATVGVIVDITDRKTAEQENTRLQSQILQCQKMEAVGTLAAGIAHDFNNMLQVILGYSDVLLSQRNRGEPGYAELQKIVKTSLEAKDLVQRIRLFSRKADIQPVAVDLNHRLTELIALLSHSLLKTIDLDVRLAENLGTIKADPALIDQMVTNLAINASEAMPDGGKLTIETRNTLLDDDYCKSHVGAKPGPHVVVSISDTGRGMTGEFLDRIFDPFFSTKQRDFHRGTGLGLSIVKGIVDEHDGYITVESEVGKGTTFKIYFSLLTTQETPEAEAQVDVPIISGGETILLVEDEELVRDLGIMFLERFGYTVIAVSDGSEALEVYAREQKNIALIILDIVMPRMDGRVCLQELLKINPAVNVLISSGLAQEDRVKEVVDLGVKGTLLKPYGMKALQEKVREVLDAAG